MRSTGQLALWAVGGTCALALLAGWMVLMRSTPPPRCQIRVRTLGITNDLTGTRFATFSLSNIGRHAVFILGPYGLENHCGEWRADLMPKTAKALGTNMMGVLPVGARRLNPAESCRVDLVLPFDDSNWRASFYYVEIWPPLAGEIHELLSRLGWTKGEVGQLVASTDWMEE
jgi:hypothetical protein